MFYLEFGFYLFNDGVEGICIFLKNGYDIILILDIEMFDEILNYEGIGVENNNFLVEKVFLEEKFFDIDIDEYN